MPPGFSDDHGMTRSVMLEPYQLFVECVWINNPA